MSSLLQAFWASALTLRGAFRFPTMDPMLRVHCGFRLVQFKGLCTVSSSWILRPVLNLQTTHSADKHWLLLNQLGNAAAIALCHDLGWWQEPCLPCSCLRCLCVCGGMAVPPVLEGACCKLQSEQVAAFDITPCLLFT